MATISEAPKYYGDNDTLELKNPHLAELDVDYLYHLGLSSADQLGQMFGDVKYVCMGGSSDRAKVFAEKAAQELGIEIPKGGLQPIGKTERFSLYKVGPVISVSHGMGLGSVEICLNEMAKLISYARARGVKFIRIGTSGGIGVEPGTVVITDRAFDDQLNPYLKKSFAGNIEHRDTVLSPELAQRMLETRGDIEAVIGSTVAATGFYEPQGRLDGAICKYGDREKMAFVKAAHRVGARNMEMEATEFAAFTNELRIPAADVCAALLNRLNGDQVTSTPAQLAQFSDNVQTVVLNFIKNELNNARKR